MQLWAIPEKGDNGRKEQEEKREGREGAGRKTGELQPKSRRGIAGP